MEYEILGAMYTTDLSKQVNDKLKEGWEPLGAPFLADHDQVYQAIIRHPSHQALPVTEREEYDA